MKNRYVLYDQAVIPRDSLNLTPEEWFRTAADCLKESLFASGNRIPFLKLWIEWMDSRFNSVGWHLPDELRYPALKTHLEKLLNKNRLFKGSRIHLLIVPVFPSAELDCSPAFRYLALTEELEYDYYPMNPKGLVIGVSERYHNASDPLVASMVRSPLRNLMVRQEAACNGWDEIVLTDPQGHLSEASESTLFIRSGNRILTPAPDNHPMPRLISGLVCSLIPRTGCTLVPAEDLAPADLAAAEEVFLADDWHGIRWVLGYEKKRYYRKTSELLHEELTELIRTTDQFQAGSSG